MKEIILRFFDIDLRKATRHAVVIFAIITLCLLAFFDMLHTKSPPMWFVILGSNIVAWLFAEKTALKGVTNEDGNLMDGGVQELVAARRLLLPRPPPPPVVPPDSPVPAPVEREAVTLPEKEPETVFSSVAPVAETPVADIRSTTPEPAAPPAGAFSPFKTGRAVPRAGQSK